MVMYCRLGHRHNGSHQDSRTSVRHEPKINGDGLALITLIDYGRLKLNKTNFPVLSMSTVKGMSKKKKGKREK